MDYEEYKRKALEPIVNYIESVIDSYSKEEIEARIKKALPEKESEDEKIRKKAIEYINAFVPYDDKEEIIAYLEKQKEKSPDQKAFETRISKLGESIIESLNLRKQVAEMVAAIEDTFPQMKEQQPTEWSEEDEKMLTGIIERGSSQVPPYEPALREEQMEWLMNRLKSPRPQPHWKPSEEQMLALGGVLDYLEESNNEDADIIRELINDLKKL